MTFGSDGTYNFGMSNPRRLAAVFAAATLALSAGPTALAAPPLAPPTRAEVKIARDWSPLLIVQEGTLPIILTAPHGGREGIDGVPRRTHGVTVRDENTDLLAKDVSAELETLLGGKPYFVIARVARTYVDLNRAASEALESPLAADYYHAFHAIVRRDVDTIRSRWPRQAILIDIHGQGVFKTSAVRGTRNGVTDATLLRRAGKDAITGPKSIFGVLESEGYPTRPATTSTDQTEERNFNGGYIVGTYGSKNADGIDAIQIESGTDLRLPAKNRKKYAHALAQAIATFYRTYIQTTPDPRKP